MKSTHALSDVSRLPSAALTSPTSPATHAAALAAAPLPPAGAPATPPGWSADTAPEPTLPPVLEGHVASVAQAAHDLDASEHYAAEFGTTAPSKPALVARLERADAWTREVERATRWLEYARAQRTLAWHDAFTATDRLQPIFEAAAAHDPSVAERYPGVVRFYAVRRSVAARSTLTRRANARAKRATPAAPAPQV